MPCNHSGFPMKSVRTTVSLSKDQYESLCCLAEKSDLSISRVIRQAVSEFLLKHNGGQLNPIGNVHSGREEGETK